MPDSSPPPSATDAEAASHRIAEDILGGALTPGARLPLRDLSARYGFGLTPLREALSRLAAAGVVEAEGQKGFRVPPLTLDHLRDLTETRQAIEPDAFARAMAAGGHAWEEELVAAFHLMQHAARRPLPADAAWLRHFEEKHARFQAALIAACPLLSLRGFCGQLYRQMTRYRMVLGRGGAPALPGVPDHAMLLDAALRRDAAAGVPALRDHIGATLEALRDGFAAGATGATQPRQSAQRDHA